MVIAFLYAAEPSPSAVGTMTDEEKTSQNDSTGESSKQEDRKSLSDIGNIRSGSEENGGEDSSDGKED